MIGFRVPSKMITIPFLREYFNRFDFIEVKISKDENLERILRYLKRDCLGRFSIHLPKYTLYNENEYLLTIKIIKLIRKIDLYSLNLVTHFYGFNQKMITRIKMLEEQLPLNSCLSIENVKHTNLIYFEELDNVMKKLSSDNIGICFDIGHFLFSCSLIGISQEKAIEFIKSKKAIMEEIKEYHIHDFNEKQDHLTLVTGNLNMKLINELIRITGKRIVIIETNVVSPETDGINQVRSVEELVNESRID